MTTDSPTTSAPARRLLPTASALSAVAFGALALTQVVSPPQSQPFVRPSDYVIEALFLTGLLLLTATVAVLHRWHAGARWGYLGAIAAAVSAAGTAVLAVTIGATLFTADTALDVLFLPGLAGWALGGVLLAVAASRARRLPRPVAILLAAAVPLSVVLGNPAGPAAVAIVWIAVAAGAAPR